MKIWRKRIGYSIDQLINDAGVCRTAPATPGLLMTNTNQYIILSICENELKRGVLELNVGGSFKYLHIPMDIIPVVSSMCEVNDNLFFLQE